MSNHSISLCVTAAYTFCRKRMTFRSPVLTHNAEVRLLNTNDPKDNAMSSIAAIPTLCLSADLSLFVAPERGNFAKASKVCPTTRVMKGEMPPDIIEMAIAGIRQRNASRLETWEKSNLTEGCGGEFVDFGGSLTFSVVFIGKEDCESLAFTD